MVLVALYSVLIAIDYILSAIPSVVIPICFDVWACSEVDVAVVLEIRFMRLLGLREKRGKEYKRS